MRKRRKRKSTPDRTLRAVLRQNRDPLSQADWEFVGDEVDKLLASGRLAAWTEVPNLVHHVIASGLDCFRCRVRGYVHDACEEVVCRQQTASLRARLLAGEDYSDLLSTGAALSGTLSCIRAMIDADILNAVEARGESTVRDIAEDLDCCADNLSSFLLDLVDDECLSAREEEADTIYAVIPCEPRRVATR